ncbi:hypothetical protein DTO166G4_4059 [Paecilomyces variotii]|uniref:DUF4440 domain-containing protein n=1 Tax=Byssochlamys spectabilis TaxID=264951 RepID=A0A443I5L5_BYSSP|nr:hypothetical protein C8Q69DRAFT_450920 [Paecilomyces variotii]KAJ9194169.1 hypothetical protein DTO032I3_7490 [Paecilomyces variotii]KAJ9214435.1 hypothetical protein DTO166G4_4059 [Paecilomyces variotii]KAJ9224482.1 hypothetical protein DTO169C6_3313 [Paecilomyces variotii]KAJ9234800.1 hypothetical protein DTO166G5_4885 [Paecilomyces variotii]KAJ9254853.1 hypothetical protein DTO207G8_3383 [Paecilomyces variotii]
MSTAKEPLDKTTASDNKQPPSKTEEQDTNATSDNTAASKSANESTDVTVSTLISITNSFLSALSNKSRPEFEKHCLKAAGMALCAPQPAPVRFCSIDTFIDRVTAMRDEIHERGWNHEVKLYEEGNMATVWVPFRAKINGVVDHVGVNLFILHKLNGVWKITGVADSSRKPTDEERQME